MTPPSRRMSLDEAFAFAREAHLRGALDDARRIYERVLTIRPDHAEALSLLGALAYRRGEEIQGDAFIDRAIDVYRARLGANDRAARAPLVNQLLARGRADEAAGYLEELDLPLFPADGDWDAFAATRTRARQAGRPPILINTIPKSASESLWRRVAGGLDMARAHVSIGLFPDCCLVPSRLAAFAEGGLVAKEHLPATPHNLDQLARHGIDRMIVHLRDPRQATLSWAHFVRADVAHRLLAPIWRKVVPPAEVLEESLEATLDWAIEEYLPYLITFLRTWRDVAERGGPAPRIAFLDFESFQRDDSDYLAKLLDHVAIAREDFDVLARPGDGHYRKGEAEEWRGVFTPEQARAAWSRIPDDLAEAFGWRP